MWVPHEADEHISDSYQKKEVECNGCQEESQESSEEGREEGQEGREEEVVIRAGAR
jgi:hypothetical protein